MKIEYSINQCDVIDLPKKFSAYLFPDIKDEVARGCVNHYFNWLENKLDSQEIYNIVIYIDGVATHEGRICAMVEMFHIE